MGKPFDIGSPANSLGVKASRASCCVFKGKCNLSAMLVHVNITWQINVCNDSQEPILDCTYVILCFSCPACELTLNKVGSPATSQRPSKQPHAGWSTVHKLIWGSKQTCPALLAASLSSVELSPATNIPCGAFKDEIWTQTYMNISVSDYWVNFCHHVVFKRENNVWQNGSITVILWKGGGTPAKLEAKERAIVRRSNDNANFDRRQIRQPAPVCCKTIMK